MKTTNQIYESVISGLQPFALSNRSMRKPRIKDYVEYNNRLQSLIVGLIIGADLSGDKIDRLAKQIKNYSRKYEKRERSETGSVTKND